MTRTSHLTQSRGRKVAALCAWLMLAGWCAPASALYGQDRSGQDRTTPRELETVVQAATRGTAYYQDHALFLPPFEGWSRANLPPAVLAETLTEGIARRASTAQIIAALEARAARAPQLAAILPPPGALPPTQDFASWLRLVETALRAGMTADALTILLAQGINRRTARAVLVAVDLLQSAGLSAAQAGELTAALLASRIPESNFENVLPLVVRNRSRFSGEELVATISAVLNSGGGFVQIEAELSARRR